MGMRDIAVTAAACVALAGAGFFSGNVISGRRSQRLSSIPPRAITKGTITRPAGHPILVIFSDYECPGCRLFDSVLQVARGRYRDTLFVGFHHYVLETAHHNARQAANAAECAREQGRFDVFDSLLFRQKNLGKVTWSHLASEASVADVAKFEACLSDLRFDAVITRDIALGNKIGLRGTPSFIIGDTMYTEVPSVPRLDSLIAREIAAAPHRKLIIRR